MARILGENSLQITLSTLWIIKTYLKILLSILFENNISNSFINYSYRCERQYGSAGGVEESEVNIRDDDDAVEQRCSFSMRLAKSRLEKVIKKPRKKRG